MSIYTVEELDAEIAELKCLVNEIKAGIRLIVAGTVQEYALDSSQTRTKAVKLDINGLQRLKQSVEAEISELIADRDGTRVVYLRGFR